MESNFAKLYLENQICFPLYAASRLTTKIYTPFLNELNITYPQYLVLMVLWQHKEKSVNEIGELLFLESNTLTPLLKRMEQKNLIQRKRSKKDERSVLISLTQDGKKLKNKAINIPDKIINQLKESPISEKELIAFRETLKILIDTLQSSYC